MGEAIGRVMLDACNHKAGTPHGSRDVAGAGTVLITEGADGAPGPPYYRAATTKLVRPQPLSHQGKGWCVQTYEYYQNRAGGM